MNSTRPVSPPISSGLLIGVLAGCALLAFFFLPSDRVLLEREMRDGSTERALATLRRMSPVERSKDPAFFELTELRLSRKQLTVRKGAEANRQLLLACRAYEKYGFRDDFLEEILERIPLVPMPQRTFETLKPYLPRMTGAAQRLVASSLAARALAEGDAVLGAQIYTLSWEQAPLSEGSTIELVAHWRAAGKAEHALRIIDRHQERSGKKLAEISPRLAQLQIQLCEESGQPARAFGLTRDLIEQNPSRVTSQLVEVLWRTAQQSSQVSKATPILRRYAEAHPSDTNAWKRLADLAVASGDPALAQKAFSHLSPGPKDILHMAKMYEWNQQPKLAFDEYLKALKLKQPEALAPLLALNPGLYRDEELADALARSTDVVLKSTNGLECARLLARTANFDPAMRLYEKLLAAQPKNFEMHCEYGRLLLDLAEYEKALAIFKRADQLKKKQTVVQRHLAEIEFRLGNYDAAYTGYREMAMVATNTAEIENFLTLSESMGRIDDSIQVLSNKVHQSKTVEPRHFQRLAHYLSMRRRPLEGRKILETGLSRFPKDSALRKELASSAALVQDYAGATEIMAQHSELKSNLEMAQFYLKLLLSTQNYRRADEFLSSGLPPEWLKQPAMLEMQAQIYESSRNWEAAAAAYQKLAGLYPKQQQYLLGQIRMLSQLGRLNEVEALVSPYVNQPDAPPEMLRAAAQAYAALHSYDNAIRCQERYLATNPTDRSFAWGMLGDMYLARKDKLNAQKAHQRALEETLLEIKSAKK